MALAGVRLEDVPLLPLYDAVSDVTLALHGNGPSSHVAEALVRLQRVTSLLLHDPQVVGSRAFRPPELHP